MVEKKVNKFGQGSSPPFFEQCPKENIFSLRTASLVLINPFQSFLTESLSIGVHIIGLPFTWVSVTVGNQTAVVPSLVHVLHAEKEIPCCNTVLLIFKLQPHLSKLYSSTRLDGRLTTYLVIKVTV